MASITTKWVICTLTLFVVTVAPIRYGRCPQVSSLPEFNVTEFLGRWYVIGVTDTSRFKDGLGCVQIEYTQSPNNSIKLETRYTPIESFVEAYTDIGEVKIPDTSKPAEFVVKYDDDLFGERHSQYRIVETDYAGFSLVTSCRELRLLELMASNLGDLVFHQAIVWVLARGLTLTQQQEVRLKEAAERLQGFGDVVAGRRDTTGCPRDRK